MAPVPLTIFRSNSKLDQNLECSSLKCTQPITTKFYTHHDNVTVVTCAKFRCDWLCLMGRGLGINVQYELWNTNSASSSLPSPFFENRPSHSTSPCITPDCMYNSVIKHVLSIIDSGGSLLTHWKRSIMMATLSSLAAPEVVVTTTSAAISHDKADIVAIFSFHCRYEVTPEVRKIFPN